MSQPSKAKKPLGVVPFKQDRVFVPSNPGKKHGGCKAGGFSKLPSYYPKDPYARIGTRKLCVYITSDVLTRTTTSIEMVFLYH